VVTHAAPQKQPKQTEQLTFTFVTDGVASAIRQARAAAGDKDVTIIGGASLARQCLQAGLIDELEIDVMPVLLGGGQRLFEDVGLEPIRLERLRVLELPGGRTHLRLRAAGRK
jgi:dihydrofolate reductase